MKNILCENADDVAGEAARALISILNAKPDLTLCLPTGRSPLGVYRELVAAHRVGKVSFRETTLFNLDEYVGLSGNDPGSFSAYMKAHFIDHIDVLFTRWHIPDGRVEDLHEEARRYDRLIAGKGGFDCVLLGVGANGHIGFNEPGSPLNSRSRVVDIAPETLTANAADLPAGPDRPTRGITIGIADILEARQIILIASGTAKAEAVKQLFGDGSAENWPVAALRDHPDITVLLDRDAAHFLPVNLV